VRLATIRTHPTTGRGTSAVRIDGDVATELAWASVDDLLRSPDWQTAAATAAGPTRPTGGLDYGPVVLRPSKVVCVGLNYRSHIEESGRPAPEYPTLFAKFARTLTGPYDQITVPKPGAVQVDWEAELAFVIGAAARSVTPLEASGVIAGYTVANDMSMRDWQTRTLQWLQGKAWEATTPIGPHLVTADECGEAADLRVTCEVDGELMQDARTSDLVFSPTEVAAYISTFITLEPGDLVLTGTSGGVGAARTPPVFIHTGQKVRTAIEALGELVNLVVLEG
jgi:acylpyruvate hydrolase